MCTGVPLASLSCGCLRASCITTDVLVQHVQVDSYMGEQGILTEDRQRFESIGTALGGVVVSIVSVVMPLLGELGSSAALPVGALVSLLFAGAGAVSLRCSVSATSDVLYTY